MTAEVSKLVAYTLIGDGGGAAISKLNAYVILEPGTEEGVEPEPKQGFSYAQTLQRVE